METGEWNETRQQGGESVWEKFVGRYLCDFNGGVAYEILPSVCVCESRRVSLLPFSHPLLVSSPTSSTFSPASLFSPRSHPWRLTNAVDRCTECRVLPSSCHMARAKQAKQVQPRDHEAAPGKPSWSLDSSSWSLGMFPARWENKHLNVKQQEDRH